MLTDAERDMLLANRPSDNKIDLKDLEALVSDMRFLYDKSLTICIIETRTGFVITGESACIDPANYNQELGERLAYDTALRKLWPLEAYAKMSRQHED